jgi:hypothetical protein
VLDLVSVVLIRIICKLVFLVQSDAIGIIQYLRGLTESEKLLKIWADKNYICSGFNGSDFIMIFYIVPSTVPYLHALKGTRYLFKYLVFFLV